MSIREDVELYTKLSGEDGSHETIATIGAYLRGYRQGKEDAEPQYKTDYGFMWLCPKCGLPVHSDYTKCVRCGHNREKGV